MRADSIGIYVHIPICIKKCNYCDFCSYPEADFLQRSEYISKLCEEILSYKGKNIRVNSIFFGGGTPSLLTASEFSSITHCIREAFLVDADVEFTVEANPGTITENILIAYRELGVNRLSMGLQSVNDCELKCLGRIHSYDTFLHNYQLCRRLGFNNVNIDVMYGIPYQTVESFSNTLRTVIDLKPEHLSMYGLIIEDNTDFYKRVSSLNLPDEDTECDMYYIACDTLHKAGYSHYEISNYARPGYECRHNIKYWEMDEYIGFGISAHSFKDHKRFSNSSDINEYITGNGRLSAGLSLDDMAYEYVMLSLRLKKGFSLEDYRMKFNSEFTVGREDLILKFKEAGLLKISNGRIALTEKGFYVSNHIISELI